MSFGAMLDAEEQMFATRAQGVKLHGIHSITADPGAAAANQGRLLVAAANHALPLASISI
jgi:hypothetical protein